MSRCYNPGCKNEVQPDTPINIGILHPTDASVRYYTVCERCLAFLPNGVDILHVDKDGRVIKKGYSMGYMTDGLTFRTLRDANVRRLPLFKTKDGKWAHTERDGSDWSPASWLQAVVGELGEYANLRKKVERGDFAFEQVKEKLASELADIVIYLDLLAFRLGIDLGQAIMDTWNKKAADLGIPMSIDAEDWHYTRALTEEEKERVSGTWATT